MLKPTQRETINEQTSATGWLHSIPSSPPKADRRNKAGTKNKNCRDMASNDAFKDSPIVCAIILQRTIQPVIGNVMHCNLRAAAPISITFGSSRKISINCGANTNPATAKSSKTRKDDCTQNQKPLLTRSNRPAP